MCLRKNNLKEFKKESKRIVNKENTEIKKRIHIFYNYKIYGFSEIKVDTITKTSSKISKYLYYINLGNYYFYNKGDSTSAFKYYSEAYNISKIINNIDFQIEALKSILFNFSYLNSQLNSDSYKEFLQKLKQCSDDSITLSFYLLFKYRLALRKKIKINKDAYNIRKEAVTFFKSNPENSLKGIFYNYHAPFYVSYIKNLDSAIIFYKKSLNLLNEHNSMIELERYNSSLVSLGAIYYNQGEYKKALNTISLSKINKLTGYLKNNHLTYYYYWKFKCYEALKKKDSANLYQIKYYKKELELNLQNASYQISNLSEKYKNKELKGKNKKQRDLIIGSILFIALGGTIATLTLQNSKRKRKLAEQQKELETQKNLTLIKEQEITTINAMVEGQEKERKRVAEDLHDNLGSVLATLKLHFENLRINREKKKINQEELFDKTENLIDEAYLKVRKIAHAKNAGVIANQGLLAAVQMMAEKISSAEKLKIEVVDFGLDKRLENTLEITVFRIIQELTTNIIKHAEATLATIQISLFDQTLNIIIEDNGKGFNPKKLQLKSGIGISSIKTRIEHLEGTFEIDSTVGKGSTFILNIPIA